jgi:dTDP-4-amino-4,6-dideoxy-D-galactose acyltransferase
VTVEAGRPNGEAVTRYLRAWPYKPHRWNAHDVERDERFVDRAQRLIDHAHGCFWGCLDNGLAGLAVIERLDWDTRILGVEAARLHLFAGGTTARPLIERAVRGASSDGIEHLSVRVDAEDDVAIHGLETAGFLNVDALMTFSAPPAAVIERFEPPALPVRTASRDDTAVLGELAAGTFVHGRFHADPSISPDRAREIYRVWATACCEGTAADTVIVAMDGAAIAGFVACRMLPDTIGHPRLATGTIPLIAIAKPQRGRGVGSALLAAAARWFREREATTIEVGTQLRNVPAARLYERTGFRLASGALSFRKMIE